MQLNCKTDSQRLLKHGIRPECLPIVAVIKFFPTLVAKSWAGLIENFLFRKSRIRKISSFSFQKKVRKTIYAPKYCLNMSFTMIKKKEATRGFFQNALLKRMRVKRMREHGSTSVLFIFKLLPRQKYTVDLLLYSLETSSLSLHSTLIPSV